MLIQQWRRTTEKTNCYNSAFFCFVYASLIDMISISSIDMISISSNSASTLQVKAVANPRSILQGVRESIKIGHSVAHSIFSASLYYINPFNSQSLKL